MSSYKSILDYLSEDQDRIDLNSLCYVNMTRKMFDQPLQPIFYNSSFNIYSDGIEIIKYKDPIKVVRQYRKEDFILAAESDGFVSSDIDSKLTSVNRDRIIKISDSGSYELNRSDLSYFDAFNRISFNVHCSRKRTLNSLYSYALSNKWNYFFTLTIDRNLYDSTNSKCINGYYKQFMRSLKKVDPEAYGLFILEYHKDKENLHLHGFIHGNISSCLIRAYNPHTNEPIFDTVGNEVYNCSLWKYGYSTCSVFKPGYNKLRVVNYLTKYVSKDFIEGSLLPYGSKMIYHSRNLNERISVNANLKEIDLLNMLIAYYYDSSAAVKFDDFSIANPESLPICKKCTDKITVYFLSYNSSQCG